jgi:hypothetical protein
MPADREESASPGTPIRRHTFATTHWSVVLATRDTDPQRAQHALELLCASYWYPVYAYLGKRHTLQRPSSGHGPKKRILDHAGKMNRSWSLKPKDGTFTWVQTHPSWRPDAIPDDA